MTMVLWWALEICNSQNVFIRQPRKIFLFKCIRISQYTVRNRSVCIIYVTGLGPRKFRSKYAELGDQSVWTDTPAEKARKTAAAREREKVKKYNMYIILGANTCMSPDVPKPSCMHTMAIFITII